MVPATDHFPWSKEVRIRGTAGLGYKYESGEWNHSLAAGKVTATVEALLRFRRKSRCGDRYQVHRKLKAVVLHVA